MATPSAEYFPHAPDTTSDPDRWVLDVAAPAGAGWQDYRAAVDAAVERHVTRRPTDDRIDADPAGFVTVAVADVADGTFCEVERVDYLDWVDRTGADERG